MAIVSYINMSSMAAGVLLIVCSHLYLHPLEALRLSLPNIRLNKHNAEIVQSKCLLLDNNYVCTI